MKGKKLKIFVVVTLFLMSSFGNVPVSSNNSLTEGTQFKYNVNKYSIDAKVNNTEIKQESFSVAGSNAITPGTSAAFFYITYTGSNTTSVSYTISKGSFNESSTIGMGNLPSSENLSLTSLTLQTGLSAITDITTLPLPYILPVSNKSDPIWTTLENNSFKDSSLSVNLQGLSVSSSVKSKVTSDKFEVTLTAKESGSVSGQNLNSQISSSITYELATGVLLGFKISLSVDAALLGSSYSGVANIEITRSDYKFSSSGLPGFDSITMVFTIFSISAIILKVRKNKSVK